MYWLYPEKALLKTGIKGFLGPSYRNILQKCEDMVVWNSFDCFASNKDIEDSLFNSSLSIKLLRWWRDGKNGVSWLECEGFNPGYLITATLASGQARKSSRSLTLTRTPTPTWRRPWRWSANPSALTIMTSRITAAHVRVRWPRFRFRISWPMTRDRTSSESTEPSERKSSIGR